MAYQKNEMRVLSRTGARTISQEELAKVTGGDEGHLPTKILSRDASGRPVDMTQD
jgi:bacteriocin-like protein